MKLKSTVIMLFSMIMLMISGCGKGEAQPVAINEKNDKCAVCNMAVMDNPFATEIMLENGKTLVFDDIGCMYEWLSDHKDKRIEEKFVRDYQSKDWVRVEDATYVYDVDVKTPMAYNVISFKDQKDAKSYVSKNNGEVLSSKQLEEHKWVMNKDMMMDMKDSNESNMDMDHKH